jgi:hypothetical protein
MLRWGRPVVRLPRSYLHQRVPHPPAKTSRSRRAGHDDAGSSRVVRTFPIRSSLPDDSLCWRSCDLMDQVGIRPRKADLPKGAVHDSFLILDGKLAWVLHDPCWHFRARRVASSWDGTQVHVTCSHLSTSLTQAPSVSPFLRAFPSPAIHLTAFPRVHHTASRLGS